MFTATVQSCTLTSSNMPLLTLSDGRAYSYCSDLQTWVLLSNPLDPLTRITGNMARNVGGNLPLASLQRSLPVNGTNENLPSSVALSFLESQILASETLNSASEFKHWVLVTVNHLLDKGPECRLRCILDDLLGPTHSSTKNKSCHILVSPTQIKSKRIEQEMKVKSEFNKK